MKAVDFCRPGGPQLRSVGLSTSSGRQTQLVLRKRKSVPRRPPSSGEFRPDSFDHAPLRDTIRLAQQGDAAAFEVIYQLYSRRVYALCLRIVRDPIEAEDLTQEALMQVFRKLNTFRGESRFSTWLHSVATNLVVMRLRKKSPPTVSIDATVDLNDETSSPTIDVGAQDLLLEGSVDRVSLDRCIERLPAGYRAAFVLHDIHGYLHREIAKIVGRSVGDSKSQLHEARTQLRQLLREVQRERARDERLVARKLGSRVRTAVPPLTAAGA